jgi:hypothetical protein
MPGALRVCRIQSSSMGAFWNNLPPGPFANEAAVETHLVVPMLRALGYDDTDIAPKYPVVFREGRSGRKPEADYVCFDGPVHNQDTSLLVIEVKAPGEPLPKGKEQGESYVASLRAPVLLLTDGLKLEIWQFQWTRQSEKVLDIPIDALSANRGAIEQWVSKSALIDYSTSLKVTSLTQLAADCGRYKDSELKRTAEYASSISRTLRSSASEENARKSTCLIDDYPRGAVILAPSGFGKSTLAHQLLRFAFENDTEGGAPSLPVLIPLADLESEGVSIQNFMQQRVAAHCPGVSPAAFTQFLRLSRVTVLCDGFDRVSAPVQRKLNSEFTNLLRDYPHIQIFIFSRGSARPNADLPVLTLDRLSDEELCELEIHVVGHHHKSAYLVSMMSESLHQICRNALLAKLTFEYWSREQQFPQKIDYLFRSWLEHLLDIGLVDQISVIRREAALTVLAGATVTSPIPVPDAVSLLEQKGFEQDVLKALLACDALRLSGSFIELQHEALADYLRSKDVASLPEDVLLKQLGTMNIARASLYPILLMSQMKSRTLQIALWKRLSEVNLEVYLDALRYRYDLSGHLNAFGTDELSRACLEDLLDGIELPLAAFFPKLRNSVVEYLVRRDAPKLGITGTLDDAHAWLHYGFRSADECRVRVGYPKGAQEVESTRGVNLGPSGYRIDSGRLIGTVDLQDILLKLSETLNLVGGVGWASERLIGRIRYLQREYGFAGSETNSLEDLQGLLQPNAEKWVATDVLGRQAFSVRSLLDDIAIMRAAGRDELDLWWRRLGWAEGVLVPTDAVLEKVLDEYFRRIQQLEVEVIQQSFPELASEFSSFTVLPLRVKITIVKNAGYERNGRMWYSFAPVALWSDAGADVIFANEPPPVASDSEMSRALEELNRPSSRYRISGMSPIPMFDAGYWRNQSSCSTAVTHEVSYSVTDDLKFIFSPLPSREA